MRRLAATVLALLVPLGAAAFAWWGADRVEVALATPHAGREDWPVLFEVPPGASAATVARRLEDERLVADARLMRAWLRASGLAGRIHAGEYSVEGPTSIVGLADLLVSGRVVLHPVTIPEGLTLPEIAARAAATGLWSEADLLAAFRDGSLVRDLDPQAPDLEGYLFPETYNVPRRLGARELAALMVERFRTEWADAGGPARAAASGRSVREVATLASLVEEETAQEGEHGPVASVYVNRLGRGMRLECDATVIYAMQKAGRWTGGPLLVRDLTFPSAWNTYVVPGLPPGPIATFGRESLRAALDPPATTFLYYVATGTGGHRFAETLTEHLRNVQLYRRWQRDARAGVAAPGPAVEPGLEPGVPSPGGAGESVAPAAPAR